MVDNKENVGSVSSSFEKAAESMGETIITVLDKLAGKKSDLKLSFEDLMLDAGPLKVKVNGSIVLDIVYASDAESTP